MSEMCNVLDIQVFVTAKATVVVLMIKTENYNYCPDIAFIF